MWIHILILIKTTDNQILNDNVIAPSCWLHGINSKKTLKDIYEIWSWNNK
jgi:hypothetical protein